MWLKPFVNTFIFLTMVFHQIVSSDWNSHLFYRKRNLNIDNTGVFIKEQCCHKENSLLDLKRMIEKDYRRDIKALKVDFNKKLRKQNTMNNIEIIKYKENKSNSDFSNAILQLAI